MALPDPVAPVRAGRPAVAGCLSCCAVPAAWSGGQDPGTVLAGQAPAGGDLGDGAFDVGPVFHVVLAQPGPGGPVGPGLPEQVIARVQDDLAAGLAGGALLAQRAVPAQRPEGGDAGAGQGDGVPGWAGDRAVLRADGEVIDGEPARYRGANRLGLDHRLVSGLADRIAQVTGAVSRVAIPAQIPAGGTVIGFARIARAIAAARRAAGSRTARRCLSGQELLRDRRVGVLPAGGLG